MKVCGEIFNGEKMDTEDVRNKLSKMGYVLLSEKYINNKTHISIEKDGYKYYITWNSLIKSHNFKKWGENNPYSIDNLKLYLKENNVKCNIISKEYGTQIELLCECGNTYKVNWNNFLTKEQYTCPQCSIKRRNKKHIKDKYIKFLNDNNLTPLELYRGCRYSIYCKTKDDYYVKVIPYNIYNNTNINDSIFDKCNNYAINNLNNYIKINELNVELLDKKFQGTKKDLHLRCKCGNDFKTSYSYFMSNHKITCLKCSQKSSLKNKIKYEEEVFVNYGLIPIEKYKGSTKRIYCIDDDGYYVYCSTESLQKYMNPKFTIFNVCNKYVIENIRRFIIIENLDCELLSNVYINNKDKLKFKCSCGNIYYNDLYHFKNGVGQQCKGCGRKHIKSKMESYVEKYLNSLNITNYREKVFEDCRDKYTLPFDFYLPYYNTLIECQGIQHYEPIEYFGGEEHLKYIQLHDKIKKQYCHKNNIKLIEISYKDFQNNKIEKIINDKLNISH